MSDEEGVLQVAQGENSRQHLNMWQLYLLLPLLLRNVKGTITCNQIASCDGNQGRLFKVMDSLMERQSDLILPHSCLMLTWSLHSPTCSQKRSHVSGVN